MSFLQLRRECSWFALCSVMMGEGGGSFLPPTEEDISPFQRAMSQSKDEVSGDNLPSSPTSGNISKRRYQSITVSGLFSHAIHVPWILGGGEKAEKPTQDEPQLCWRTAAT